jgi:hypothetical protein
MSQETKRDVLKNASKTLKPPHRQGFWLDKHGRLYVGYLQSEDNFHYGYIEPRAGLTMTHTSASYPENNSLKPISFEEGIRHLCRLIDEGIVNARDR